MLTAVKPAPGCTMGKGTSPPARKLASLPFTAIRFGSARICSRFFCCKACTTAPRFRSVRNKNRFSGLLRLIIGLVVVLDVVEPPAFEVVLVELVEVVNPPDCPVVEVPIVF